MRSSRDAVRVRAGLTLAVLTLVVPILGPSPSAAMDLACPLPTVTPAATSEGLNMGIFVTDTAPTGSAATNLLTHLDHLSGGERDSLTIHLFSHYRGAASPPGVVEHEADVEWFADQGFPVELTVPYRVPIGSPADPAGYVTYLETVVERVGSRLNALMVTNEVNIDFWEGPSDGIHPGALDALISGVPAASAVIDHLGLDIEVGFKWAYRHPNLASEHAFWTAVGDQGGDAFRDALDFVGVDLYAFDFYVEDNTFADYTFQALAELRTCFLPLASIGMSTPLRITESGAPTLMWGEDGQTEAIAQMVGTAYAHSESLNVDGWRQWGLYCGPTPPGVGALFHCTGLLREDGSPLPSYPLVTELVAGNGTIPTDPIPTEPTPTVPPPEPATTAPPNDASPGRVAAATPQAGGQPAPLITSQPRYAG